jgi:hypothetical protein
MVKLKIIFSLTILLALSGCSLYQNYENITNTRKDICNTVKYPPCPKIYQPYSGV